MARDQSRRGPLGGGHGRTEVVPRGQAPGGGRHGQHPVDLGRVVRVAEVTPGATSRRAPSRRATALLVTPLPCSWRARSNRRARAAGEARRHRAVRSHLQDAGHTLHHQQVVHQVPEAVHEPARGRQAEAA